MSSLLIKRLNNELIELQKYPITNCSAGIKTNDITHWLATIIGPDETPYAGGIFMLDIKFPNEYPFVPPKVYFITPIYHCNINRHYI